MFFSDHRSRRVAIDESISRSDLAEERIAGLSIIKCRGNAERARRVRIHLDMSAFNCQATADEVGSIHEPYPNNNSLQNPTVTY
jgi:hypothetical protein